MGLFFCTKKEKKFFVENIFNERFGERSFFLHQKTQYLEPHMYKVTK
jgi:hypothetical protein